MKKFTSALLTLALILSLTACGGNGETNPAGAEETANIQVDEGLFNVKVTIAASYFEDQTEEEIKEDAKEKGYSDCEINADGSVTYTMSKKKHKEVLDQMKTEVDETIADCLEGENKVASFIDIQYNDNISEVNIYVDAEKYTMWDNLYAWTFFFTGAYYQMFDGVDSEKIDVVVSFIDNTSKEVLYLSSYRERMDSINNSAE